jgi:putative transposase
VSRHEGRDKEILKKIKEVYEEARMKNPKRWPREIRNWKMIEKLYLNYLQEEKRNVIVEAS